MKVYVDELPKRCDECPYYYRDESEYDGCYECCSWCGYEFSKQTCPLQSLTDYTKQVRKEVCEEIMSKGKIKYGYNPSHKDGIKQVLVIDKDILNQIQGETK